MIEDRRIDKPRLQINRYFTLVQDGQPVNSEHYLFADLAIDEAGRIADVTGEIVIVQEHTTVNYAVVYVRRDAGTGGAVPACPPAPPSRPPRSRSSLPSSSRPG